jgi:hypothetical protein
LTDCRITITIGSMSNGVGTSPQSVKRAATRSALVINPLPWPEPGRAAIRALTRHAHNCLACGATYECRGPGEIGYCAPVCQPCHWIELGSQLRIYQEVISALRRKRTTIERRIGRGFCRSAAAHRRKIKTDAGLLVAFGNVLSTQPAASLAGMRREAREGGSHE